MTQPQDGFAFAENPAGDHTGELVPGRGRALVSFAVALLCLGGVACGGGEDSGESDVEPPARERELAAQGERGSYEEELAYLERRIESERRHARGPSASWLDLETLANVEIDRARLTGDYGGYASAESLLALAFAQAAEGAGPFLSRARLNSALHRFDRVEIDLTSAERRAPTDDQLEAEIAGLRADIDFHCGRYDESLAASVKAYALRRDIAALFRVARYYWKTGEFGRADSLLDGCLEIPHGASTRLAAWLHLQKGLMSLDRGRLDEAMAEYVAADSLFRGWWLIEEQMAEIMVRRGRLDEAREAYESLIERTGDPEFMDALASIHRELGDEPAARALIARARAVYERRLVRFPEATAGHAIRHFLQIDPDPLRAVSLAEANSRLRCGAEAKTLLARAYLIAGRDDDAVQAIEDALATRWNTAELHATAASVYHVHGDSVLEERALAAARAIDPSAEEWGGVANVSARAEGSAR